MLYNVGAENPAVLAWDGTTAYPRRLIGYNSFSFVFEATADIETDAVFNLQFAPVSDADPCEPGEFADFAEPEICGVAPYTEGQTSLVIPAGTVAGAICSITPPCLGGAYGQLVAVSGDTANLRAVLVYAGPQA